jgi:hypothetical protein
LIATDDLPCMQVLTTARSTRRRAARGLNLMRRPSTRQSIDRCNTRRPCRALCSSRTTPRCYRFAPAAGSRSLARKAPPSR